MKIQIEEQNVREFEKLVNTLNKKAARLNVAPLSVKFIEKQNSCKTLHLDNGKSESFPVVVHVYEVSDVDVYEAGWKVVASIVTVEGEDNFTTFFKDSKLDLSPYRSRPHYCEHCNTQRNRNITFVVEHKDGRVMQVGRSCMKEVLAGGSLSALEFRSEMFQIIRDICDNEEDFFGRSRTSGETVRVRGVIAAAEKLFDLCGVWVNNQWSEGWERYLTVPGTHRIAKDLFTSTDANGVLKEAAHVCGAYTPATPAAFFSNENDAHFSEQAEAIIEEVQAIDENELDEFGKLVQYVTSFNAVPAKMGSVAAYAGQFLRRRKEEQERAAKQANMRHVGTVGSKEQFEIQFAHAAGFNSDFGWVNIYTFEDKAGNQLVWKTGKDVNFPEGFFNVTAKVKRHSEFRGSPQTEINYVKVLA